MCNTDTIVAKYQNDSEQYMVYTQKGIFNVRGVRW